MRRLLLPVMILLPATAMAAQADGHGDPVAPLTLALVLVLATAKLGGELAVRAEANLHEDETAKLVRMGRCLKADHALHVTIEGNADERGTEEWNLALGDKRASAVEDYLERLGVSTTQLRKATFGKDHPLCTQHNEECWAKNRRAALKTKESR